MSMELDKSRRQLRDINNISVVMVKALHSGAKLQGSASGSSDLAHATPRRRPHMTRHEARRGSHT